MSQSAGPVQEEGEDEGDGGEGGEPHLHPHHHHHHQLVETPCDNEKCIMCTPVPQSQPRPRQQQQQQPANNKNPPEENNQLQSNLRQLPPPLPAKTVAPYQVMSGSQSGPRDNNEMRVGQKFQQLSALKHYLATVEQHKFPECVFYDVKYLNM